MASTVIQTVEMHTGGEVKLHDISCGQFLPDFVYSQQGSSLMDIPTWKGERYWRKGLMPGTSWIISEQGASESYMGSTSTVEYMDVRVG